MTSVSYPVIQIGNTSRVNVKLQANSIDFIERVLRNTTAQVIKQQEDLGNPVTFMLVDGQANKPLISAKRKVLALFGNRRVRSLMLHTEQMLFHFIGMKTRPKSGRLSSPAQWTWLLARKGQKGRAVTPQTMDMLPLLPGDSLVLKPSLAYVAAVNSRTRKGGPGFMGKTADFLRNSPDYKNFNISAGHSVRFPTAGEVWKYGTPFISISPRRTARK